jgi:hypothetical protein
MEAASQMMRATWRIGDPREARLFSPAGFLLLQSEILHLATTQRYSLSSLFDGGLGHFEFQTIISNLFSDMNEGLKLQRWSRKAAIHSGSVPFKKCVK